MNETDERYLEDQYGDQEYNEEAIDKVNALV